MEPLLPGDQVRNGGQDKMKNAKRIAALVLSLALILALAACGGSTGDHDTQITGSPATVDPASGSDVSDATPRPPTATWSPTWPMSRRRAPW